jgi:hypothetical protein
MLSELVREFLNPRTKLELDFKPLTTIRIIRRDVTAIETNKYGLARLSRIGNLVGKNCCLQSWTGYY